MRRALVILATSLGLLTLASLALAQGQVQRVRQVIGAGGLSARGDHVSLSSTVGQPFAGWGANGEVALGHGFWYGLLQGVSSAVYLPIIQHLVPTPTSTPPPIAYADPCAPANNWCEDNDRKSESYGPLRPDVAYQAFAQDEEDWYYVTLSKAGSLLVQLSNYQAIGFLFLYDQGLGELGADDNVGDSGKTTLSVNVPGLTPGDYFVRIYTYPQSLNPGVLYALTVSD